MSNTAGIESGVKAVLETSVKAFEDGVKVNVKNLEKVLKVWSGAVEGNGAAAEWQTYSKAVLERTTPAVQKSADEMIKLGEHNYKLGTDLLKKLVEPAAGTSVADVTARTQDVLKATLGVVRASTEAVTQTNARVVEMWREVLRSNIAQGEGLVRSVVAASKAA